MRSKDGVDQVQRRRALNDVNHSFSETGWRTAGALVDAREWAEYSLGRATTQEHLGALDLVYNGVISSYRDGMKELDALDLVTQDMFIGQIEQLELFHWFVRAHLEDKGGRLSTAGSTSEEAAAAAAKEA